MITELALTLQVNDEPSAVADALDAAAAAARLVDGDRERFAKAERLLLAAQAIRQREAGETNLLTHGREALQLLA